MIYKFIALAAVFVFAISVIVTGCSQTTALDLFSDSIDSGLGIEQIETYE